MINKAQRGLKAGTVWVNCWVRMPATPHAMCASAVLVWLLMPCAACRMSTMLLCPSAATSSRASAGTCCVHIVCFNAEKPALLGGCGTCLSVQARSSMGFCRDKGQDALANYTQACTALSCCTVAQTAGSC